MCVLLRLVSGFLDVHHGLSAGHRSPVSLSILHLDLLLQLADRHRQILLFSAHLDYFIPALLLHNRVDLHLDHKRRELSGRSFG